MILLANCSTIYDPPDQHVRKQFQFQLKTSFQTGDSSNGIQVHHRWSADDPEQRTRIYLFLVYSFSLSNPK